MNANTKTTPPIPTDGTLPAMIRAALAAGRDIMDVYAGHIDVDLKDDNSPLTEADRRSHASIETILSEDSTTADIPILSEEGADSPFPTRSGWSRYFLIDPLDGTKEFIKRNGEFTVNIALMDRAPADQTAPSHATAGQTAPGQTAPGQAQAGLPDSDEAPAEGRGSDGPQSTPSGTHTPVAGVVYAPDMHVLYIGLVGHGAWRILDCPANPSRLEAILDQAELLPAGDLIRPEEAPTSARSTNGAGRQHPDGSVLDGRPTSPGSPDSNGGQPRRDGTPANGTRRPYTIVASRSHMSPETEAFVEHRRAGYPDLQLISAGSSLKLCRVAEGSADEYPRFAPTMEWDTAAGDAVARAAGCAVVEWHGPTGDNTIAAPSTAVPSVGTPSIGTPVGPLVYNKRDLHNPWFLVRRTDNSI